MHNLRRIVAAVGPNLSPITFAALIVLFFYTTKQQSFCPFDTVCGCVAACIAGATISFIVLRMLCGSCNKAALLTILFQAFCYTLIILEPFKEILHDMSLAVCCYWALLAFGAYVVIRTPDTLEEVSHALNKLCLWAVSTQIGIIACHAVFWYGYLLPQVALSDTALDESMAYKISERPDIYYLILDGFASENTFHTLFGENLSGFTSRLRKLGYTVPEASHSNYGQTVLSVPSFLNMSYLDPLAEINKRNGCEATLNNELIRNNRLARILHRAGYKTIQISSEFTPAGWNPFMDENKVTSWLNDPTYMFLQRTIFGVVFSDVLINEKRNSRLREFDSLCATVREDGPKFVSMHILMPHPPYFFDREGNSIKPEGGETDWSSAQSKSESLYVGQAVFLTKLLDKFACHVEQQSKRPYVVIMHGDHGSAMTGSLYSDKPSTTYLRERMGIFLAFKFPNYEGKQIPADITPVNVPRLLLNNYLGANYPLLPNRSYFSSYVHPYKFTDVTNVLIDRKPNDVQLSAK